MCGDDTLVWSVEMIRFEMIRDVSVEMIRFETLVVFTPIFVADTKITFIYNLVAPLTSIHRNRLFKYFKRKWN